MVRSPRFALVFALPALLGLSTVVLPVDAVATALVQAAETLRIENPAKGQKWIPGRHTNKKERRYRERRGIKKPGTVSLRVDNGRGSVFLNGRFAGTAPLESYVVPSGKNDLQVRDGQVVLADGILIVPGGDDVKTVVTHP